MSREDSYPQWGNNDNDYSGSIATHESGGLLEKNTFLPWPRSGVVRCNSEK